MTKENQNLYEAKKSLKSHIAIFESLLNDLNGPHEAIKQRSMWIAWCFNRYISDNLIADMRQAMEDHGAATKN